MSDHEASYLQDTIAAKYHYVVERGVSPLHYGEDAWRRSLNAILRDRRVDPFKEWLESLPPWDKEKRLDFYLDDLFSAGRLELVQWVGRYIFLGSLVARIGMETEFSLSQAVASGDAFEHRPSERGHCVEDFSAELNLRDLPGEAAGFEFGADDALPTAHLRFYSAALVVPCCRLPSHAPVAADLAKMAIPNGRITRRLRADHCVLWRWYDHIQGLPIPLPQQISCG